MWTTTREEEMNFTSFITAAVLVLNGVTAVGSFNKLARNMIRDLHREDSSLEIIKPQLYSHLSYITENQRRVAVVQPENMEKLLNFLEQEKVSLQIAKARLFGEQAETVDGLDIEEVTNRLEIIENFLRYCPGGFCGMLVYNLADVEPYYE